MVISSYKITVYGFIMMLQELQGYINDQEGVENQMKHKKKFEKKLFHSYLPGEVIISILDLALEDIM